MKVLVTGIAGFLASHVAAELEQNGHSVVGYDVRQTDRWPTVVGDLTDLSTLERTVAEVDAVCHLGGVGDVYRAFEEPAMAASANVVGTANVAEAARRNGRCRVVYASTWEVYGPPKYQPIDEDHPCDPDHPYNITKYAGERIALSLDHLKGVPTVALRLGTAFGTGMRPNSVFSLFIDRARNGQPIVINGTGAQTRQFTHATDIARAFRLAAESDLRGVALNTVSSENISIRQLAEMVTARLPTSIEYREARTGDIAPAIVSSERARQRLGWEPRTSFKAGLDALIDHTLTS